MEASTLPVTKPDCPVEGFPSLLVCLCFCVFFVAFKLKKWKIIEHSGTWSTIERLGACSFHSKGKCCASSISHVEHVHILCSESNIIQYASAKGCWKSESESLNYQRSPRGDSHGLWPSWPFRVELQAFCLRMQQSDSGSTTVVTVECLHGRKTEICPEVFGWSISQKTFTAGAGENPCELLYHLLPLWRIGSLIFLRTEVANAMELECRNFKGLDVRLKPTEFDVSQQVRRWSFCCYFHMMTQDHQVKIFVLRLLVFRSPMWPSICCACNYDSLWCFLCLMISTSKRCQCACWKPSPVNVCVPGRFSTKIRRNGLTIWWSSQMWMQFGWQKAGPNHSWYPY